MPEGDTLHRTAARLRPALVDQVVERFEAPRLAGSGVAPGARVLDVRAVGKHLFVDFDTGQSLETHLGMPGSWHLARRGERWRRPRRDMRALVVVAEWEAICFLAPMVRLRRSPGGRVRPEHLGPDLCLPEPEIDATLDRLARFVDNDTEIGVALLDQRIAAGIGNVYKCEVLAAVGVDPFRRVADVPVEDRRRLYETAAQFLRVNLTASRRTTFDGGLAVYGRAGRSCRRCGATVEVARQGEQNRSTWWCPACQPAAGGAFSRPHPPGG